MAEGLERRRPGSFFLVPLVLGLIALAYNGLQFYQMAAWSPDTPLPGRLDLRVVVPVAVTLCALALQQAASGGPMDPR